MARLWHTGFEWQSIADELLTVNGSPSIDTSVFNGGAASMECSGTLAADGVHSVQTHVIATVTTGYARWYVYVDTLPTDTSVVVFCDLISTSTNVVSIQLYNNGGTLEGVVYWNNFGNTSSTFTTNLALDTWLRVEAFYSSADADGSEDLTVRINGTDVVTVTNATFTTKNFNTLAWGVYNGTAGSIDTEVVYFDDVAVNNNSGSINNSWPGAGEIVVAVPTAAGDNAANAGTYASIDEIPPSTDTTVTTERIDLDTTTSIGDYNVASASTLGIGSSDTINAISVVGKVREEAAGTSNYTLRIKSASGGTVATNTSSDAGNATTRTNPTGTTPFTNELISETDPTTGSAWTPTGTNSIDNMQIGAATTDGNPDIWVLALAAMIDYTPVSAVTISSNDIAISLTEDATTINQDHIIAGADVAISLTEDADTITQNHVVATNDVAISLTEDNTTVDHNHVLPTADMAISLTTDNTTITQNHVFSPDDIAFSLATDNDTISQNHIIATQDVAISLTTDNTTINQNHVVAGNDVAISLTTDNGTVAETNFILATQDTAIGLALDATTINQDHIIAGADVAISLTEDADTITQNHVIATQDITFSLTADNTTVEEMAETVNIYPDDVAINLTEYTTTITQNHVFSPDDIAFSLASDSDTISQNHVIATQDLLLSLTTDNATITQNHLITAVDLELALRLDNGYAYDGTAQSQRSYYIDSSGDVYWVVNQTLGLVEKI